MLPSCNGHLTKPLILLIQMKKVDKHKKRIIKLKKTIKLLYTTIILFLTIVGASAQSTVNHRLIVITDIGNEPDDFMSMVRLMLYTNQIDL